MRFFNETKIFFEPPEMTIKLSIKSEMIVPVAIYHFQQRKFFKLKIHSLQKL